MIVMILKSMSIDSVMTKKERDPVPANVLFWLSVTSVRGTQREKYRKTLKMQFSTFSYCFMVFKRDICGN